MWSIIVTASGAIHLKLAWSLNHLKIGTILLHRDLTLWFPVHTIQPGQSQTNKAAYRGEYYYCCRPSRNFSALITSGRNDPTEQQGGDFSPTEMRILQLVCEDYESKEIAEKMNISLTTVNRYRAQLLEIAGVKNAAALLFFLVNNGLLRW